MIDIDPWELLREAQRIVQVYGPIEATDLVMRIDDALAYYKNLHPQQQQTTEDIPCAYMVEDDDAEE